MTAELLSDEAQVARLVDRTRQIQNVLEGSGATHPDRMATAMVRMTQPGLGAHEFQVLMGPQGPQGTADAKATADKARADTAASEKALNQARGRHTQADGDQTRLGESGAADTSDSSTRMYEVTPSPSAARTPTLTLTAQAPGCHTSCTETCAKEHAQGKKHPICDLPYSATSYDKTPQQHTDGKVKFNKRSPSARDKARLAGCKNQIEGKVGKVEKSYRGNNSCTSCKRGTHAFVPRWANLRTGQCKPLVEQSSVQCTTLDRDYWDGTKKASNGMEKNVICTK